MTGLSSIPQIAQIPGLQAALDAKAALASPTFTGTPEAPTAAPGTDTTQLATTAFVKALGDLKANLTGAAFTGAVSLGNGVVTSGTLGGGETYTLALSNAWSDVGTVFEALRVNMTDGGSHASSLLFHLLLGSVSKFSVSKDGAVVAAGGALFNGDINNTGTLTSSQTWNSAATVFSGLLLDITDTTSHASSLLANLKVGGVSKFSVSKGGLLAAVSVEASSYIKSAGYVRAISRLWASDVGKLTFGDSEDTGLFRYAAGVLEVNNGTAGQRRDLMVRALWDSGGNQVIGSRGTAVAAVATADSAVTAVADATDLATALTLVNDLKAKYNAAVTLINEQKVQLNTLLARCRATGGHGLIAD